MRFNKKIYGLFDHWNVHNKSRLNCLQKKEINLRVFSFLFVFKRVFGNRAQWQMDMKAMNFSTEKKLQQCKNIIILPKISVKICRDLIFCAVMDFLLFQNEIPYGCKKYSVACYCLVKLEIWREKQTLYFKTLQWKYGCYRIIIRQDRITIFVSVWRNDVIWWPTKRSRKKEKKKSLKMKKKTTTVNIVNSVGMVTQIGVKMESEK